MKKHEYHTKLTWTGNLGLGTKDYKSYSRNYSIDIQNKISINGSSDPNFLGEKTKHNPEELFVSSISSCHMLWFLHLASSKGIVVNEYVDNAKGIMIETEDGGGYFESVILNPIVTIFDNRRIEETNKLHQQANKYCFIANSLNFKVIHRPTCKVLI
jgi:organic hydroperoxide reductase OsmC/OhrA